MSNEATNPASCQTAEMRSAYFLVLIFSYLETILKINQK